MRAFKILIPVIFSICFWYFSPRAPQRGLAEVPIRNFHMMLWDNISGADADYPSFFEGQHQPPGRSLLIVMAWNFPNFLEIWGQEVARENYDLTRIEGVIFDEPYWNATGAADTTNPCLHGSADPRLALLSQAHPRLQLALRLYRQLAPHARLWVNYSEPELNWQKSGKCPISIFEPMVDVVSMDIYGRDFQQYLRPLYDWLIANRARADQQIALIAGTFFEDGGKDATTNNVQAAAARLQGYFDYAQEKNQQCGAIGPHSDGCPVWMVAGWPAHAYPSSPTSTWRGEQDPASAPIHDVWRAEFSKPARDTLFGYIDDFGVGIRGWAVDAQKLDESVFVDFWIDGQYAGEAPANGTRLDVNELYGPAKSGFQYYVPTRYRDGRTHRLDIYLVAPTRETWNHLLLNPVSKNRFTLNQTPDPISGAVETVLTTGPERGTVSGWAMDPATEGSVILDFWVDGKYAAETHVSLPRPDGRPGFSLRLPDSLRDGKPHQLTVYGIAPSAESWNHLQLGSRTIQLPVNLVRPNVTIVLPPKR
ncbi:MAG: hypothetical protein ACXVCH_04280 [Bdellovibrionota bacterium]